MKNRLYIYLTLCWISLLAMDCWGQQYKFNHFSVKEGLSEPFIYTINQDDKGFLWIGTGEGLFRYDGFHFNHYTTQDSLAGYFITESMKDSAGNLWFGHMNGGITQYNGKTFMKIHLNGNQNAITDICQGRKRNIWIATQTEGLYRVDARKNISHIPLPFEEEYVSSLCYLEKEYLFIGTNRNLYLARPNETDDALKQMTKIKSIPESNIIQIIHSESDNKLAVVSKDQGVYILEPKTNGSHFSISQTDTLLQDKTENIQGGLMDQAGNIWLNTMGSGVYRITPSSASPNKTLHLHTQNGLLTNDVKCIFEDREGNIWLGLYGHGLLRFVEEKILFYDYSSQFPKNAFYTLNGSGKQLWAGTDKHIIKLNPENGKVISIYGPEIGIPDEKVTTLFHHPRGNIWIGTEKSGIYQFNPSSHSIQKVPISSQELENSINHITGDQNNIWVATKKGICHIDLKDKTKTWYNTNTGLPHNNVPHLYLDSQERILAGTLSNELIVIDPHKGTLKQVPIFKTEGLMLINSITEDKAGYIWVCTYGNGVFRINHNDIQHFSRDDGLLSNYGYSLTCCNNKIFVGHHGGISAINIQTGNIKSYDKNYAIKSATEFYINATYADTNHNIWFGTSEGIARFSSQQNNKDTITPKLNITGVQVDNRQVAPAHDMTLKPGNYELEFRYIGIQLRDPESVKYRYKLKGYNKRWSEPTKERVATFGNVRPGEYTFLLSASNENGISTKAPMQITIKVKKHIYQSIWFYVTLIILLLLMGYAIIIIRERNLKREKRNLEKKVRQRTQELYRANEELALRNEDITASIEYAKRIQLAILPSHIPFDNTMIFFRPKDIVSGDFYWFTSYKGLQYMAAVDCTGHGVPGAFMSFIGHTALKKIVIEHKIQNPSDILVHLNEEVATTLNQSEEDILKDGMDIGLVCYNPVNRSLQYAGGFIPMWLVRKNQLHEYKGNRISVGQSMESNIQFTWHQVHIEKGDAIYLMSDGYASQFGGEHGRKFKSTHLKDLIVSIQQNDLQEQYRILEQTLDEWMGGKNEQVDDIMIIGRKFIS